MGESLASDTATQGNCRHALSCTFLGSNVRGSLKSSGLNKLAKGVTVTLCVQLTLNSTGGAARGCVHVKRPEPSSPCCVGVCSTVGPTDTRANCRFQL